MMLAISLMRMGAKKKPFYRVVVKEKRSKRDGKYLENVGTYNPMTNPAEVDLNHERVSYWISVGAQPTETVASLIKHNPAQTEEEKAEALEARAAKAEAEKTAKAEAKRAEADARKTEAEKAEVEKAEAARIEAEKAEAEKAETENAEETKAEETAPDEAKSEETESEASV
ncbi:MAG: 30S ribosomal protein S16 [Acidobacteria bacterium]|nr:30S ribosomal protein S16 [Acidobacteriota bacterium]